MKKEFIPYNEAKELKELGFDEGCLGQYHICNTEELKEIYDKEYFFTENSNFFNSMCELIYAPLYQQAFRYFREVYNYRYKIEPTIKNKLQLFIHDNMCWKYIGEFNTFEEAELTCLQKLIEIVKLR